MVWFFEGDVYDIIVEIFGEDVDYNMFEVFDVLDGVEF